MADKGDLWMPLYVGDYLRDTGRLSTEAHGAYLLLIMDYWINGPLPDDDAILATISRLSPDAWSMHRALLKQFFRVSSGQWKHKRIEQERSEAQSNANRRKTKAKAAADARWGCKEDAPSNAPSMPEALPEECPSPSPSPVVVEDRGQGPPRNLIDLAKAITAATGLAIDPSSKFWPEDIERMRQWVALGLTHEEIVDGVRSKVAGSPEAVVTLKYCDRTVRQMISRREHLNGNAPSNSPRRSGSRPASRADEMDATLERFLAAEADRPERDAATG